MNSFRKSLLFAATTICFTGIFASCEDAVEVKEVDKTPYTLHNEVIGSLRSYDSPIDFQKVDIYKDDVAPRAQLLFSISKAADKAIEGRIVYDPSGIEDYNAANLTDFQPLPEGAFTLQDDGRILIAPGNKMEYATKVYINKESGLLQEGVAYMAPFKIKSITDGATISSDDNYTFIIENKGDIPSTDKGTGIRCVRYFGNDTNPLSMLEYTLEDGKPFFDIACLFAANINWDRERHCIFLKFNPWITRMLNDRERYLVPLQKKGIKVTLSLLTGVSVMTDDAARDMAKQLKDVVDAYGLDGLEFDDEYNKDFDHNSPGIHESSQSYRRLVFECKKLMPDKIMAVYDYGSVYAFESPIDGVHAGQYVDYAMEAMYGGANYSTGFKGMSNSQIGPYSRHGGDGKFRVSGSTVERIREEGYGIQMFFGFPNWSRYENDLQVMSNAYFDQNIVFSGKTVTKDW